MIEIKNKTRGPVQLLVRSKLAPRQFTTLNVPGIGKGKNIIYIEDERWTDIIERVEGWGMISTRHVPNQLKDIESEKGEE